MINIWNQMEIYIGNPSKELKDILSILSKNGIKYKSRIFNPNSVHFFSTRILSLDFLNFKNDPNAIYYIYVKKGDYKTARDLIDKIQA